MYVNQCMKIKQKIRILKSISSTSPYSQLFQKGGKTKQNIQYQMLFFVYFVAGAIATKRILELLKVHIEDMF